MAKKQTNHPYITRNKKNFMEYGVAHESGDREIIWPWLFLHKQAGDDHEIKNIQRG